MTRVEFIALPYLLTPGQVMACGYAPATIAKYAANGILVEVRPKGCRHRRYQKRQLAALLGWADTIAERAWRAEKPLLGAGAVREWTGFDRHTIKHIADAGGLTRVQPGGIGEAKYRKSEVGVWIGLE